MKNWIRFVCAFENARVVILKTVFKTFSLLLLFIGFFYPIGFLYAEEAPIKNKRTNVRDPQEQIIQSLQEKLTNADGSPVNVTLLKPIDYTNTNLSDRVAEALVSSLSQYSLTNVQRTSYAMDSLTSDDLQLAAYQLQSDIIFAAILTEYQFELFVFDSVEPTKIFTSNQPIPDPRNSDFDQAQVQYYSDLLVSRTLSLYANGFYYELPTKSENEEEQEATKIDPKGEEVIPTLPRSIAAVEDLGDVFTEDYYSSPGLGVTFGKGKDGESWLKYNFSVQFGAKIQQNLFAELSIDHFRYTAFTLSGKYLFPTRNENVSFFAGLGVSQIIRRHPWEGIVQDSSLTDVTPNRQNQGFYIAPVIGAIYKYEWVQFRIETRAFLGSDGRRIITFTPGVISSF